ncbi:MAG: hypothetical protein KQH63_22095 [Desulfobulbaceae bacterium]|nr:hypothetical protein [Desulfobulbaceae bacterium]
MLNNHPQGLKFIIFISAIVAIAWGVVSFITTTKLITSGDIPIYGIILLVLMTTLYSYLTYGLIFLKNAARKIMVFMSLVMVAGAIVKLATYYINYVRSEFYYTYPILAAITKLIIFTYVSIYLSKPTIKILFEGKNTQQGHKRGTAEALFLK